MTRVLHYATGDTAPSMMLYLLDNDNEAIPVTGGTVVAKIRKDGDTSNTNDANNTCTIVDGAAGKVRYDPTNTDFPTIGKYYAQVQAVLTSGREFTNKNNVEIRVKEKF